MTTGINYLDEVWSPITGCSGKGCKANCWARTWVNMRPIIHGWDKNMEPIPFSTVQFHPERLDKPLHWKKPRRIGVAFCGDWMDRQVRDEWIGRILAIISDCPQHTFFTLTKQADRLASIKPSIPNLWNGVSITDQDDLWMVRELFKIPGKHWLSIEPMLSGINMRRFFCHSIHCDAAPRINDPMSWAGQGKNCTCPTIDWVVLGCESGPKRRPCYWPWMIDVVEQCKSAGIPAYIKQVIINGKVVHDINLFPPELRVRELAADRG